jgi:hypothetical protein
MLSRLSALYVWLGYRVFTTMAAIYITAASLVGFETLALLLGYATMSPIAVPVMIAGIALWAVIRRRVRTKLDDFGPVSRRERARLLR